MGSEMCIRDSIIFAFLFSACLKSLAPVQGDSLEAKGDGDIKSCCNNNKKECALSSNSVGSRFKCGRCCKTFKDHWYLRAHVRTHLGEKAFSCNTCGQAFTKSSELKIHERIHTGENPFSCKTCGKAFTQSIHLKSHERIHTGEKPISCNTCGKACLLYTSPSPRDLSTSRMPSSA